MAVKFTETGIPGVRVCEPDVYPDERGFFMETYQHPRYAAAGIADPFVQDNYSRSSRGVLRGMHYQIEHAQGKLVYVIHGEIVDVVVDVRKGSPTFGKWEAFTLSDENRRQVYVPIGLAHGFCVLSEKVDVLYKCTDVYNPAGERGLLWSDPGIGVEWPIEVPLVSDRDTLHPCLENIPDADLPRFG